MPQPAGPPCPGDRALTPHPPPGSDSGTRSNRGGSWLDFSTGVRAASRSDAVVELLAPYLGFRLARPLPASTA